jgi:hypothetical protein
MSAKANVEHIYRDKSVSSVMSAKWTRMLLHAVAAAPLAPSIPRCRASAPSLL